MGKQGIEHQTEGNTWRLPGGDNLQGTHFHRGFLFREINVSVHFHRPGTAQANFLYSSSFYIRPCEWPCCGDQKG